MIGAFQRSGFQNNGFQVGTEEELRGKFRRRGRTKIWTDEELGINKLPKKVVAPAIVARQRLIDLLPKLEAPKGDVESARREASRLIRRLRQNERRIRELEEEEIAFLLELLD